MQLAARNGQMSRLPAANDLYISVRLDLDRWETDLRALKSSCCAPVFVCNPVAIACDEASDSSCFEVVLPWGEDINVADLSSSALLSTTLNLVEARHHIFVESTL